MRASGRECSSQLVRSGSQCTVVPEIFIQNQLSNGWWSLEAEFRILKSFLLGNIRHLQSKISCPEDVPLFVWRNISRTGHFEWRPCVELQQGATSRTSLLPHLVISILFFFKTSASLRSYSSFSYFFQFLHVSFNWTRRRQFLLRICPIQLAF
jgi:hypothetical protein